MFPRWREVARLMAFGLKYLRHIILQVLHTELQISLVEFSGKHLCLLDLAASVFRVEIIHRLSQNDLRPDQARTLWFYFWLWHFSLIMVYQAVSLCHPQSQNLHFEDIVIIFKKKTYLHCKNYSLWVGLLVANIVIYETLSSSMIGNHTLDMLQAGEDGSSTWAKLLLIQDTCDEQGTRYQPWDPQFVSVSSVTVTPNIGSPTLPGELLTGATWLKFGSFSFPLPSLWWRC